MRSRKDDTLTIEVTGREKFIPVDSFLEIVRSALEILWDLDASVSQSESATLDWQIVEASFNSPLRFAIAGQTECEADLSSEILRAYVSGFEQIEQGMVPRYFTQDALGHAKEMISALNDGIARVTFRVPGQEPVEVTRQVINNLDAIITLQHEETEDESSVTLEAKAGSRIEEGAMLIGRLETLTVHGGKAAFYIFDSLTGDKITCFFPEARLEEAKAALPHRVAVTGKARYNREGKPTSIQVEDFTPLRERHELPQMKDLEGINLTGDIDPTEYIRRLRDG